MEEIICNTCLSRNRTLLVLDIVRYGSVFGDTKLAPDTKLVCWECAAMFRKLHHFRSQVLRAQALMDVTVQQSLSRLKSTSLKSIDVCCDEITHMKDTLNIGIKEDIHQDDDVTKIATAFIKTEHDLDDISYDVNDDTDASSEDKAQRPMNDKSKRTYRINSDTRKRTGISISKTKTLNTIEAKSENITIDTKINNSDNDIDATDLTKIKNEQDNGDVMCSNDKLRKDNNIIITDNSKQIVNKSCSNYYDIKISKDELNERRQQQRQSQKYREYFKLKCDDCIVGFYDGDVYEKHMKTKHSESIGKYVCTVCKVRFPRPSRLKAHVESHFTKYQCRLCSFLTYKLSQIKLHDAKEHGNMQFSCLTCDARFVSHSALRLHREREHSAPFACELCVKTFNTRNNLLSHNNAVHKAKRYECHICHEKCQQLPQHMLRKHAAGEKHEAYCAECDKRFATRNIYKIHLKLSAKHRAPETLKHACTQCNAKFVSSTGLKKHVLAVHRNERAFKCLRCDKGFHRAVKLRAHVDFEHDGKERPKDHVCQVCGRGFGSKQTLSNHVRTHTGERPFPCASCGAAFGQRSALRTHQRRVHREDRITNKAY